MSTRRTNSRYNLRPRSAASTAIVEARVRRRPKTSAKRVITEKDELSGTKHGREMEMDDPEEDPEEEEEDLYGESSNKETRGGDTAEPNKGDGTIIADVTKVFLSLRLLTIVG